MEEERKKDGFKINHCNHKLNFILKYLKNYWFPILLLVIGLHITLFQLLGYDLKHVIGDLGDSRFIASIIEYNYQWLCGNYNNYWDGFFMYPDKEVISYSDNLLGVLPIYSLFRFFGSDTLTAFQLLLIVCHILNFWFCFYCFHQLSDNKYAAAAGAFIFAFSIALNGVHNHPQYTFRFCIPLFFFFLHQYLNTLQIKFLIYSSIALVVQFYLGIYLGYFLVITAAIFLLCYFLFHPDQLKQFGKMFKNKLIALAILIAGLFPLFYFYYKRSQVTGYYTDYDFYMQTIPRISSYFKSFNGSLIWGFLNNTNVNSKYEWVHFLFPGIIVFVSLTLSIFLALKKQKNYMILVSVVLIFISFTIYFEGHTLYGYLMKIPGIKAARVVSRISTVLIFFLAWMVCLNIDMLQKKLTINTKTWLILLPLILVLDNYCLPSGFKTFEKEESNMRVNKLEEKIVSLGNLKTQKAFAYIPGIKKDSQFYQIDAMMCALKLQCKTVNGYSSSCHKQFGSFWRDIDSTSLNYWCKTMQLPIDSVTIVY